MSDLPREAPTPHPGDAVFFSYGGQWIPAVVVAVSRVEYYQHLKPLRAMSVYVDLDVALEASQHPQSLEGVVMRVIGVGYSNNPKHDHMWCLLGDMK